MNNFYKQSDFEINEIQENLKRAINKCNELEIDSDDVN